MNATRENRLKVVSGAVLVTAALLFFVRPVVSQETVAEAPAVQPPAAKPAAPASPAVTPAGVRTSAPVKPMAPPEMPKLPKADDAEANKDKPAPYRGPVTSTPKPIVIDRSTETLEQRMSRTITLDVREMNVLDVVKFLALKGDFNMVTGSQVAGRVTLFLKNVKINDALDIIVISNNLAYYVEKEIVYILSDAEYMMLFGKHFNEKNKVEIIQLKYAKPSYVLATLESLKSALGKIIIDEDTGSVVLIDTPESLAKMRKALNEIEFPLEPITYALQYAKADVVAEKLRLRLDAHAVGTITVDERSNKLIIRALPERRKEVQQMIKELDAPTKEVLVEVRVLQVVFKPQMDYGIDWQLDFRSSSVKELQKLSFKNLLIPENNLAASSNLASTYGRIAYGDFSQDSFEMAIRALRQVNDTRILSNPRLLVTNNEEAKIHVGDTVPYIISTTSGTGDNAITSEDVRFVDVGVKINVTPTINDDGFVTMRLLPEISTVTGKVDSKGGGIPQINKTMLESTVMVKDGMTIVLGGLKKESKAQTRKGIPVLMDLPYLRNIFGSTSESVEATEIVIFITPHIIKGDEDYRKFRGDIKPEQDYLGDAKDQKLKTQALEIKG